MMHALIITLILISRCIVAMEQDPVAAPTQMRNPESLAGTNKFWIMQQGKLTAVEGTAEPILTKNPETNTYTIIRTARLTAPKALAWKKMVSKDAAKAKEITQWIPVELLTLSEPFQTPPQIPLSTDALMTAYHTNTSTLQPRELLTEIARRSCLQTIARKSQLALRDEYKQEVAKLERWLTDNEMTTESLKDSISMLKDAVVAQKLQQEENSAARTGETCSVM